MKLEEYIQECKDHAEEDDLACFIAANPDTGGYTNTYIGLGENLDLVREIFDMQGIEILAEVHFYEEKNG